jgi:hypothetical protein
MAVSVYVTRLLLNLVKEPGIAKMLLVFYAVCSHAFVYRHSPDRRDDLMLVSGLSGLRVEGKTHRCGHIVNSVQKYVVSRRRAARRSPEEVGDHIACNVGMAFLNTCSRFHLNAGAFFYFKRYTVDESFGSGVGGQTVVCTFDFAHDFGLGFVFFVVTGRKHGWREEDVDIDVVEHKLGLQSVGKAFGSPSR